MDSHRANPRRVLLGVTVCFILAGLPLLNKKIYQREQVWHS